MRRDLGSVLSGQISYRKDKILMQTWRICARGRTGGARRSIPHHSPAWFCICRTSWAQFFHEHRSALLGFPLLRLMFSCRAFFGLNSARLFPLILGSVWRAGIHACWQEKNSLQSLYFSLVSATASLLHALSVAIALKFILDTQNRCWQPLHLISCMLI